MEECLHCNCQNHHFQGSDLSGDRLINGRDLGRVCDFIHGYLTLVQYEMNTNYHTTCTNNITQYSSVDWLFQMGNAYMVIVYAHHDI